MSCNKVYIEILMQSQITSKAGLPDLIPDNVNNINCYIFQRDNYPLLLFTVTCHASHPMRQ